MPLREFLQMFRGKLESSPQKTPSPTEISSGPENELVELVWENGQIMMQGQSNRAKKSPLLNDYRSQRHRVPDRHTGNASISKVEKFGALGYSLNDAPASLPSGDVYLTQEDEMVPWLQYPEDDGFKQTFCSDSAEISGVTSNDPSSHNSFLSLGNESFNQMLQHTHSVPVHNEPNLEVRNAAKVSSRTGFSNSYFPVQGQISVSAGAVVLNTDTNTTSNRPNACFGRSVEGQASAEDFNSVKTQKQNTGLPGTGTSILNFSHFSRPVALFRASLEKADELPASCSSGPEKMGNEKFSAASNINPMKSSLVKPCGNSGKEIYFHGQPKVVPTKVNLRESVTKQSKDSCHTEQSHAHHQEDVIKSPRQAIGVGTTKELTEAEKPVENVLAASSACSGNSGERASNDQIRNSKRKVQDNDESESRSEENEEESVAVKKPPQARGYGSKRSRAAEVHNLSERRRRDRINEKMRALQELIPNCNKADKASMLDEAIEYLKTLQLQVQMMSMGAGLCMPPMMFPTGLPHMHPAHMPHFPTLARGMGMGMGFGMGMLDMNSGSQRFPMYPVPPMQGAHFPSPISGTPAFPGMAGANLQVFGHPGQGLPMLVPGAPLVPMMGQAPMNPALGLDNARIRVPAEAASASPTFDSELLQQRENLPLSRNMDSGRSTNQTTSQPQATNKDFDQSALASKDDHVPSVSATAANLTATNDVISNKGGD